MKVCKTCQRVYRCEDDFLTSTSRWRLSSEKGLYFTCSCFSTLVLPHGTYEWYHPTKFMRPQARDVFNRLALAEGIPRIPAAVYELQALLSDPNADPTKIVEALKREPVIAADLLKLANLFRTTRAEPIISLEHALMFVGRRVLSELTMAAALKQFKFRTRLYTEQKYWSEAFAAAFIAERLATLARPNLPADQVYLGACLANIGKVVGAVCLPETIDGVWRVCEDKATHWERAETLTGAPQHIILGEIAAVLWGLPDFFRHTASSHHLASTVTDQQFATADERVSQTIVSLANQLGHWLFSQPHRIDNELMRVAATSLGYSDGALEKVIADCQPFRAKIEAMASH